VRLINTGIAGTMESGDILIEITESEISGITITLESTVENQFGGQIKATIKNTIAEYGLDNVNVHAIDKGSLDCTIRARVTAAILRGCQSEKYRW